MRLDKLESEACKIADLWRVAKDRPGMGGRWCQRADGSDSAHSRTEPAGVTRSRSDSEH